MLAVLTMTAVAQTPTPEEDASLLAKHSMPTDVAGLKKFFEDRTLSKEEIASLKEKVEMLRSPVYAERNQASKELVKAGQAAKPFLVAVVQDPQVDLEMSRRAEQCLRLIQDGPDPILAQACARLLAHHKIEEAPKLLLDYMPFTTDHDVLDVLQRILNTTAVISGRPHDAVLKALGDSHDGKRAMAGEALIRAGGPGFRARVEPLLRDPSTHVRWRVTAALVERQDRASVPFLIDLLTHVSLDDCWQVEDLLRRVSQDSGPSIYVDNAKTAAAAQAAWKTWWDKNKDSVDLAKLSDVPPMQNLTLISYVNFRNPGNINQGTVMELTHDKKVRWEIKNLNYPVDAQVVGPDRVLITETNLNRVTERDIKGNIKTTHNAQNPMGCQKFPDGKLFIATRHQLQLLDRDNKVVFTKEANMKYGIMGAGRARDGYMVLIQRDPIKAGVVNKIGYSCTWLDPAGKALKTFPIGRIYTNNGSLDVLAGGRVILPHYVENKVVEYDRDGKVKWEAKVQYPMSAQRLPNGNTLVVTGPVTNNGQRLVELDRAGKEVWSHVVDGQILKARKR
jgi:hypothetical protein